MSQYNFSMRQLLDSGAHIGHRENFWNPKMAPYIYGVRNGIHIIDLQQTVPHLVVALNFLKEVASKNGRVLFVGTKSQASDVVEEYAQKCGQYYVNHRWLGGTLTNWNTVSNSIQTLKEYENMLFDEDISITKKERLTLTRKHQNLQKVLGGIRNMGGMPDVLFIIDTNKESLAVKEANKLGIPIIAIVDSNSSPDGIDYVIPGNDDARKAITLYLQLACDAVLSGMQESMVKSGVDIGAISEDFDVSNENSKEDEVAEQQ
jgi:small subunit ribosomal protein S2